jgi:Peptidase family M23
MAASSKKLYNFTYLCCDLPIFAQQGTAVRSATQGYIVRMGHNALGGKVVLIARAGGRRYYYAHLEAFAADLRVGMYITSETLIGFVGNTGNAARTPPHLHFAVYTVVGAVNPLPMLQGSGAIHTLLRRQREEQALRRRKTRGVEQPLADVCDFANPPIVVAAILGEHQAEKTPCRSQASGGGISDAPSGTCPRRHAYEPGGVSIAALLIARAAATRSSDHEARTLHACCSQLYMSCSRRVVQRQEIS